ncbi:MAG: D-alanyl-D-alanine carboxypeptidase, partial [Gemmatimonadales bacterium]
MVNSPRFWIFAALAGTGIAPLQAQTLGPDLRDRLAEWSRTAQRRAPGQWGVAIANESGRLLYGVEPQQMLVPASTVKLFTTGFARTVLGGDARISTRVLGNGELDPATGVWNGTWSLEINGDPSLENPSGNGPRLADLARQLAGRGIRRLTGPLNVISRDGSVASAEYPSTWAARHRGRLFAPPVGALTLHENIVSLTVGPGARSGMVPEIVHDEPAGVRSLVTMRAKTVAGRRSRLRLNAREDGGWIISGTIGTGARPRHFAAVATHPRAVLARAWATALESAGIEWVETDSNGPAHEAIEPYVLAEVNSPVFDSIAIDVNRRSLNLGAELMLQWAAVHAGPA